MQHTETFEVELIWEALGDGAPTPEPEDIAEWIREGLRVCELPRADDLIVTRAG